jgi:hypothetical protein
MHLITYTHCGLGCAIAQAVTNQPATAKTRVRSHVSLCEILGTQDRKGKVFSPSILVFSCQVHPINAPYPSSATPTRRNNEQSLRNFKNRSALSEIGKHWIERYFHFFCILCSKSYMSADVIKVVMMLQHVWGRREVYTGFW